MLVALFTENRKELQETVAEARQMYDAANERKYGIMPVLRQLEQQKIETAHFYVQVVDYLCEVTKALLHCTKPAYDHINNNHRGLTGEQIKDLKVVNDKVDDIFTKIDTMLREKDFSHLDEVMVMRDELFDIIADTIKCQIRRLQDDPNASTRASALFLNLLGETKTMVLQARNFIKSQAYFLNAISGDGKKE